MTAHQSGGNARRMAVDVLYQLSAGRQSLDWLMESAYEKGGLDQRDKNLLYTLVYGVLRWRGRLDWTVAELSTRTFEKINPRVLNILRLGLFQLLFLDRVPDSAAVDTAVRLARSSGLAWATGYVNALLRNFLRNRGKMQLPDYGKEPSTALAVRKSLPRWLARRWIDRYGLKKAQMLADTVNRIPPLTVRANTLKTTRTKLLTALAHETSAAEPTPYAPQGITLKNPKHAVAQLAAFKFGLFQVQDEAAQLVSIMLAPRPGEQVLDACAGLGGKTGHIAQIMENQGHITALDIRRWRLVKLEAEMKRLGITIVTNQNRDLRAITDEGFQQAFDRVLVDAPCSGLGVLQRNPDAKWSVSEYDLARQGRRQTLLLHHAAGQVKPGCTMVYAVCSIETEENEDVVYEFLKNHPDFAVETAPLTNLPAARELVDMNGFLKTFPPRDAMDGFFAATLKRQA